MIRVDRNDDVWTVTIDRADKANALTEDMLKELTDIAIAARDIKVFILTGAGRVFSAGADLDQAAKGLAVSDQWETLSSAIAEIKGLSVAALNGTVAGGAFGMVLACDVRVSVGAAKFFYPVMRLGFLPQPSDVRRMVEFVGPSRAKLILMGGQKILADEALSIGLIDRIIDDEDVLGAAMLLSQDAQLAKQSHVAAIKSMIQS
ncbi:enoyl-CoA hydratase [Marivivens niveibacter]|uniref:Enoyl-CoA hydratase n=1 Tax=Marivivens niveibacter TaxID=1930667 RepID=A0A251WZS3_9RHOB|nr:enoyl-CoA hydratase/isomerase family protein [Marivivens niveibacter]OUD09564.1 enoyl-CoA hydratase [Marivivens niveibacter]